LIGEIVSRKSSWIDGLSDLFHRLMDSIDPVILGISAKKKQKMPKQKNLSQEILSLLQEPKLPVGAVDDESEED